MKLQLLIEKTIDQLINQNWKPNNKRGRTQPLQVSLLAFNKSNNKATFKVHGMTADYVLRVDLPMVVKPGKKLTDYNIKISCSCPDFKYRENWTLANKEDAAERRYDNGDPPNIRDPQRKHYLCKHCVKAKEALSKYSFDKRLNLVKA